MRFKNQHVNTKIYSTPPDEYELYTPSHMFVNSPKQPEK